MAPISARRARIYPRFANGDGRTAGDSRRDHGCTRDTPKRAHRVASRRGVGRQRWPRVNGQSSDWRRRRRMPPEWCAGGRRCRLAAGALAMAAGEYVSVSSHADTERADLEVERREQAQDSEAEVQELAEIYIGRGVDPPLARQVAQQLMVRDALGAPARDQLGISTIGQPRPLQAAFAASANACFRLAGVIRLAAPSSSCSPQRPQFESSFIARRKSASVAIVGRAYLSPHVVAVHPTNQEHSDDATQQTDTDSHGVTPSRSRASSDE